MIELVIVYCLAADQTKCIEKRDPDASFGDPVACMADAQMSAQAYLEDHPKWRLARWRCEVNVPRQQNT
ncbi:MAG TPA: hypothetical protein VMB71_08430 [Acetobacteraceae bacterium]|nr:hypothetical protein [Acetobacteraceae bacterium]